VIFPTLSFVFNQCIFLKYSFLGKEVKHMLRFLFAIALVVLLFLPSPSPASTFYVCEDENGALYQLKDINNDGDALDMGEVSLYGNGLNNPTSLALWNGSVYASQDTHQNITSFHDANNDGDALDPFERATYAELPTDTLNTGLAVSPAGHLFSANYGSGTVSRSSELNNDGDALDTGETMQYASGLTGPRGMTLFGDALYVAEYGAGRISVIRDRNNDGDGSDANERTPYTPFGSLSGVYDIVPDGTGGFYVSRDTGTITHIVDVNGDGDGLDAGELLSYANNDTLLSGIRGLTRAGESLVTVNYVTGAIYWIEDLNHDGDALDFDEVRLYATGFNHPTDIVTPLPGTLLLLGSGLVAIMGMRQRYRMRKE
jgi:hypothetical protein